MSQHRYPSTSSSGSTDTVPSFQFIQPFGLAMWFASFIAFIVMFVLVIVDARDLMKTARTAGWRTSLQVELWRDAFFPWLRPSQRDRESAGRRSSGRHGGGERAAPAYTGLTGASTVGVPGQRTNVGSTVSLLRSGGGGGGATMPADQMSILSSRTAATATTVATTLTTPAPTSAPAPISLLQNQAVPSENSLHSVRAPNLLQRSNSSSTSVTDSIGLSAPADPSSATSSGGGDTMSIRSANTLATTTTTTITTGEQASRRSKKKKRASPNDQPVLDLLRQVPADRPVYIDTSHVVYTSNDPQAIAAMEHYHRHRQTNQTNADSNNAASAASVGATAGTSSGTPPSGNSPSVRSRLVASTSSIGRSNSARITARPVTTIQPDRIIPHPSLASAASAGHTSSNGSTAAASSGQGPLHTTNGTSTSSTGNNNTDPANAQWYVLASPDLNDRSGRRSRRRRDQSQQASSPLTGAPTTANNTTPGSALIGTGNAQNQTNTTQPATAVGSEQAAAAAATTVTAQPGVPSPTQASQASNSAEPPPEYEP